MNMLLLGATGQLGQSFIEQGGLATLGTLSTASRRGQDYAGRRCEAADLSQPDSLPALLDQLRPQLIVNAAAYTAVDRAEQEEALATRVNGQALGVLGRWAAEHGALVLHYSTDYVFDGAAQAPYPVDAPTQPVGAYGRSKLAGERALKESGAAHLIFRTAWVYAAHGQNFLRTMLRLGTERAELRVVADQHGTPTSTDLIVRASLQALARYRSLDTEARCQLQGVHHLVASGQTTWHGFAEAIFDEALQRGLLPRRPRVWPITTAEFPTPAKRPAWSVLDTAECTRRFEITLVDWRSELQAVIGKLAQP